MDGTLSSIDLGTSVRYQMTRKEDGRTKTIYVPQRAAAEVADWTGRWRQVRELLKELSEFSRQEFPGLLEKPATKKSGRGGSGSSSSGGEGPQAPCGRRRPGGDTFGGAVSAPEQVRAILPVRP